MTFCCVAWDNSASLVNWWLLCEGVGKFIFLLLQCYMYVYTYTLIAMERFPEYLKV